MMRSLLWAPAAISVFLSLACGPVTPPSKPGEGAETGAADTTVVTPVAETTAEPVETAAPHETAAPVQTSAPVQSAEPVSAGGFDACIARLRDATASAGDSSNSAAATEYQTAFAAEKSGTLDQARKGYLKLIQNYPQSSLIPAAYFAFGEMFFVEAQKDPSKYALAEQSYREVIKYPAPANTVHAAAAYRLRQVLSKTSGQAGNQAKVEKALSAQCR